MLQLLKAGSSLGKNNEVELYDSNMIGNLGSGGSDAQLEETYNEIGDYYFERQNYASAVKYYLMGRNLAQQAECYYILEDYQSLSKLLDQLTENHELLPKLADMFESVGMCGQACEAYLKVSKQLSAIYFCHLPEIKFFSSILFNKKVSKC